MKHTTSEAVTRNIRVQVRAQFSPEHSDAERPVWFFVYTITLTNEGTETVQLLQRSWEITDGRGHVEHVQGPGVVGKQPVLAPGESFEYTSGCPLPTRFGFMRGHYQMVLTETGELFEIEVAGFPLQMEPSALN